MTDPILTGSAVVSAAKVLSSANKAGVFAGPIKSLNHIWYIALGHRFELRAQEIALENQFNLEKFSQSLEDKVSKIPEESIQEPPINIVGPAIESSKFHMGEYEIREMFAQLIASSMTRSRTSDIHPSFVEIIKMLSPLDARNLKHLQQQGKNQPIVNIKTTFIHNNGFVLDYKHVFFIHDNNFELEKQELSIDNLMRLKLVDVSYTEHLTNAEVYKKYELLPSYIELEKKYKKENDYLDEVLQSLEAGNYIQSATMSEDEKNKEKEQIEKKRLRVDIGKGVINLTSFGSAFCRVCL